MTLVVTELSDRVSGQKLRPKYGFLRADHLPCSVRMNAGRSLIVTQSKPSSRSVATEFVDRPLNPCLRRLSDLLEIYSMDSLCCRHSVDFQHTSVGRGVRNQCGYPGQVPPGINCIADLVRYL